MSGGCTFEKSNSIWTSTGFSIVHDGNVFNFYIFGI